MIADLRDLTILVAYGEIALKSRRVRGGLERLLARQIEERLRRGGFPDARALRRFGRIYVEGVTADAAHIIADVFGVVSAEALTLRGFAARDAFFALVGVERLALTGMMF